MIEKFENHNETDWNTLPTELKLTIIDYLVDIRDLLSFRLVSKAEHDLLNIWHFWQKIYSRRYSQDQQNSKFYSDEIIQQCLLDDMKTRHLLPFQPLSSNALDIHSFFMLTKSGSLQEIKKRKLSTELLFFRKKGFDAFDYAGYYDHQELLDYFFKVLAEKTIELFPEEYQDFCAWWKNKNGNFSHQDEDSSCSFQVEKNQITFPLSYLAILCQQEDALNWFLKNKEDFSSPQQFIISAAKKKPSIFQLIVNHPAIKTDQITLGNALRVAARWGILETVDFLIKKEAPLKTNNNSVDNHVIFDAINSRNLDTVKAIVSHAPESTYEISPLETPWQPGSTPLLYTLLNYESSLKICRDKEIAMYLLEQGSDINLKNKWQNSPLISATKNGDVALLKGLLAHPNIQLKKRSFEELFSIAVEHQYLSIVKEYLSHPLSSVSDEILLEVTTMDISFLNDSFIIAHDIERQEKAYKNYFLILQMILSTHPDKAHAVINEEPLLLIALKKTPQKYQYDVIKLLLTYDAYSYKNEASLKTIKTYMSDIKNNPKIQALFQLEGCIHKNFSSPFWEKKELQRLKKNAAQAIHDYLYVNPIIHLLNEHFETIRTSKSLKKICDVLEIPLISQIENENIIRPYS